MKKSIKYRKLANKRMKLKVLETFFVIIVTIASFVVWGIVITASVLTSNISMIIGMVIGSAGTFIATEWTEKSIEETEKSIKEIEKKISKLKK